MHVLEDDDIQFKEDLTIDAGLVQVLDVQTKTLWGNDIRMVKVFGMKLHKKWLGS